MHASITRQASNERQLRARGLYAGQDITKSHQLYLYKFIIYNVLQCIIESQFNWLVDASCLLLGGTAAGRLKGLSPADQWAATCQALPQAALHIGCSGVAGWIMQSKLHQVFAAGRRRM